MNMLNDQYAPLGIFPRAVQLVDLGDVETVGARGDWRQVTDASIVVGSPVITSATIAFTQADVGKHVLVRTGSITNLVGTIISVQSATAATASANADGTAPNRTLEVSTDDTAAFQAAIDAYPDGGPVLVPDGTFRITSTLNLRKLTSIVGIGTGYAGDVFGTRIIGNTLGGAPLFATPANARNNRFENLYLEGPGAGVASSGCDAIGASGFPFNLIIRNCVITGWYRGVNVTFGQNVRLDGNYIHANASNALRLSGCSNVVSTGNLYANSGSANTATDANVLLEGGTAACTFIEGLQDEGPTGATPGGAWFLRDCSDIIVCVPMLYFSDDNYGVRVGNGSTTPDRITILGTFVQPFAGDRVPINTIKIEAGATRVSLINVTTDPNGGGDISDAGTDSLWLNVNGQTKLPNAAAGFFGATPAVKPTVSGSRGGNAALADLLSELATLGLITDSTSA